MDSEVSIPPEQALAMRVASEPSLTWEIGRHDVFCRVASHRPQLSYRRS
jgi:hypothetical protein